MYFVQELDNGIKVVIEKLDNIKSVSLGIIVEIGSRYENYMNNGMSHFIEHMLFRGTSNRTAREISLIIDKIGGNVNAFTSKENTCYYVQVLKEHLDIAINLLSDMFLNPLFDKEDIRRERMVIEEEINMYLDDTEDLVHELLDETLYYNTPLSLPVLGNINSIRKLDAEILKDFFFKYYNPTNIIISVAGNLNPDDTFEKINNYFGRLASKYDYDNINNDNLKNKLYSISQTNKIRGIVKQVEQLNLCMGFPGTSSKSNDLYIYSILNNIFVNNEGSRLYQTLRESGYVYSLYSNITTYKDTGDISIYMGLSNSQIENVLTLIDRELSILCNNYINHEELQIAKEQLKINYILDNENPLSRMFGNARSVSLSGNIETEDEVLEKIDIIDRSDIINIINKSFKRSNINIAYISNIKNDSIIEQLVKNKIFRGG